MLLAQIYNPVVHQMEVQCDEMIAQEGKSEDHQGLQFILRGTLICGPNFMAIFSVAVETFH